MIIFIALINNKHYVSYCTAMYPIAVTLKNSLDQSIKFRSRLKRLFYYLKKNTVILLEITGYKVI